MLLKYLGYADCETRFGDRKTLEIEDFRGPRSRTVTQDLRDKESAKIKCGKANFEALAVGENPASYLVARNIGDLMAKVV